MLMFLKLQIFREVTRSVLSVLLSFDAKDSFGSLSRTY